ncbi:MAG: thermopsin family protease, partial [Thermoplasmataceae archaeon]
WTQNVALYSTKTHKLTLIDNIWNFTGFYLNQNSILSGNGTKSFGFYYDVGPSFNLSGKFSLNLSLVTSVIGGETAVKFLYNIIDPTKNYNGVYDTVLFNSESLNQNSSVTPEAKFLVSGTKLTPIGLLNDAEFILGGPGGGSSASFYNLSANMTLRYLNGGKYTNVKTAYDFGGDTGETATGVSIAWKNSIAQLTRGPSFLYGMWNDSKISKMNNYSGKISPSNSFFFVSQGSNFSVSNASWAPLGTSGKFNFSLPSGNYSGNISLSDHSSKSFTLTPSSVYSLQLNMRRGIYTPLYAMNNSQIHYISSSGNGTSLSPYLLFNNSLHNVSRLFSESNDFGFSVFSGVLLYNTTANTDINNVSLLTVEKRFRFPTGNQGAHYYYCNDSLNDYFISTSNLTLWNSNINGSGSVFLVNSVHDLIGKNNFSNSMEELFVLGGSHNYIWGNHFQNTAESNSIVGLYLNSSANTIYNNYFYGLIIPAVSTKNYSSSYIHNKWNITNETSRDITVFNNYKLSGSIIGTSYQGGNYWWNYNGVKPFNDSGFIKNSAGDAVPLIAKNFLIFTETSNSSIPFSVVVNGVQFFEPIINGSGSPITINLVNGTYNYSICSFDQRYTPVPENGTVFLNGNTVEINVSFKFSNINASVSFSEQGLPSGTSWSVTIGGKTLQSNSRTISSSVPLGSLFYIKNVDGYIPFPSHGAISYSGQQISIVFESSEAQKYGYNIGALNEITGQFTNGSSIPANNYQPQSNDGTLFSAYDHSTGDLFVSTFIGSISVVNISTNKVIKLINLGGMNSALDIAYGDKTGYIYVNSINESSFNGGPQNVKSCLFIINPSSMSIIKKIDYLKGQFDIFLTVDNSNGLVYSSQYNGGNVTVINGTTGNIIKTISLGNEN